MFYNFTVCEYTIFSIIVPLLYADVDTDRKLLKNLALNIKKKNHVRFRYKPNDFMIKYFHFAS